MRKVVMLMSLVTVAALAGDSMSPAVAAAGQERRQAAAAPATVARIPSLKIVAFGDSLTSGHRLPKTDAYPAVLERSLRAAGLPFTVVNRGISGDTTAGAVRRLEAALAEQPHILIVAFGANDGLRGVPVKQVRDNLEKIIETAEDRGVKVLLVGMEALPLYGWQYTIDFHNVFPDLADKFDVPLVPFMLNGVLGNPDLMSSDGLHPNAAGARLIAANIWTALEPIAQSLVASAAD
jgi:acyl-CoA thioesterase-1